MGNSGSIHHIASGLDELHSYYQHQNVGQSGHSNSGLDYNNHDVFQNPNGPNTSWSNSNRYSHRNSFNSQQRRHLHPHAQQQPHIKVLPELNNGPRLRSTMNGAILHSGGTISGRKDSLTPTPAIIQRSKTSINYEPINRNRSSESAPPVFRRSQTQLNMITTISRQESSKYSKDGKNFVSEPDLRGSDADEYKPLQNSQTQLNTSKTKIKIKKRKAPLAPSASTVELQSSFKDQSKPIDKSANRNKNIQVLGNHRTQQKQNLQSTTIEDRANDHEQKQQQNLRKLRLFKTKAESKNSSTSGQQNMKKQGQTKSSVPMKIPSTIDPIQTKETHGTDANISNISSTKTNWIESKIKLLPVPVFRREKSFDVSLLSQHHRHQTPPLIKTITGKDDIANSRQRINANKSYNDDNSRRQSEFMDRQASRTSFIESRFLPHRKYSTPPKASSQTLFQNELEAATKRRSLAVVESLEKTNISKLTIGKLKNVQTTIDPTSQSKKIAPVRLPSIFDDSKPATSAVTPKKGKTPNIPNAVSATKTNTTIATAKNSEPGSKVIMSTSSTVASGTTKTPSKIPQLTKTFYFGMENSSESISDILPSDLPELASVLESEPVNLRKNSSGLPNQEVDNIDHSQMKVIDEFAKNIMFSQNPLGYRCRKNNEKDEFSMGSSESAGSSDEIDMINIGIAAVGGVRSKNVYPLPNYSNNELDEINNENGIQVTVRPTLPRRQLEIPRFSPSAAWRMLSAEHKEILLRLKQQRDGEASSSSRDILEFSKMLASGGDSKMINDQQPLEKLIERNYREPYPLYSVDNKSGDSGISGDGGFHHDRTDAIRVPNLVSDIGAKNCVMTADSNNTQDNLAEERNINIGPFLPTWTPQEDLEEDDSSSDGGGDITKTDPTRGHVFSLSLPRETHLSVYGEKDKPPGFSSLQKLKRTVSSAFSGGSSGNSVTGGCLGNSSPHILTSPGISSLNPPLDGILSHGISCGGNYRSDNWLLSRSAPNSIDNSSSPQITIDGGTIAMGHKDKNSDEINGKSSSPNFLINRQISIQPLTLSFLTAGKHVMYLPNQPIGESSDFQEVDFRTDCSLKHSIIENKKSPEYRKGNNGNKKRENLQDMPTCRIIESSVAKKSSVAKQINSGSSKISRNHRFTFQSTVRQIERRRLAEKLSKEAEQKEAQRKSELEAMRRVEEEFQMKRAREKASIRHQLRLYSMEENQQHCTSLPHDWQETAHSSQHHRADPDGAVSSSSSSTSPLTHHRNQEMPILKATPFFNNDDISLSYNSNSIIEQTKPSITSILPFEPTMPPNAKPLLTHWNSSSGRDTRQQSPIEGHFTLISERNSNVMFDKSERLPNDSKGRHQNYRDTGHSTENDKNFEQFANDFNIGSNHSEKQLQKFQNIPTTSRSISSESEQSNARHFHQRAAKDPTDNIHHQFRDIHYQHQSRCAELY